MLVEKRWLFAILHLNSTAININKHPCLFRFMYGPTTFIAALSSSYIAITLGVLQHFKLSDLSLLIITILIKMWCYENDKPVNILIRHTAFNTYVLQSPIWYLYYNTRVRIRQVVARHQALWLFNTSILLGNHGNASSREAVFWPGECNNAQTRVFIE